MSGRAVKVVVVGAGFTGVVAAYELRKRLGPAAHIVLVEAERRIGGNIRSAALGDATVDVGAESFLANSPDIARLAQELGLSDRIVSSSSARPNVFAAQSTHPLPLGTYFGLPARGVESTLLSPADEAMMEQDSPTYWDSATDMSIAELVEPVYGSSVRARLVDPMLSGVYAGDSFTIGVRSGLPGLALRLDEQSRNGPLVSVLDAVEAARGAMATGAAATGKGGMFRSFHGGISVLLDSLLQAAQPQEIILGQTVRRIEEAGSAPGGSNGYWVDPVGNVDAVVIAVGSSVAGKLLAGINPEASRAASSISTASPIVVALRCAQWDIADSMSGVLVAAGEGLAAKALTLTSNKWTHVKEPEGRGGSRYVARASFGRVGDDLSHTPDEQLLAWAVSDFTRIFHQKVEVTDWAIERYPEALPQYGIKHNQIADVITAGCSGSIAVAGNYLRGVGLGACAATATTAAHNVTEALHKAAGDRR